MLINNAKQVNGIIIPKYLKEKVLIASNHSLLNTDIRLFNIALQIVFEEINSDIIKGIIDEVLDNLKRVNIIFTKNGELSFSGIEKELGVHFSIIIYKMEPLHYLENQRLTLFTFVEELTHHFWGIEDETKVKYKVIEIMKRYDKDITLEIVKGWGIYGL